MKEDVVIAKTADMIKEKFSEEGSGHDWWHIYRVWQLSKTIAKQEKGINNVVIELGSLLHDIADYKLHNGDESIGGKEARKWLESFNTNENIINEVVHIVDNISFKGGIEPNKMKSKEGLIVQDADKLDAIGAIGIARCFTFGGYKERILYDPHIPYRKNLSKKEYKKRNGTTINHFYEKLLKLKDLMNTKTGKKIAVERHTFMEDFLKRFYEEWEGYV